MDGPIFHFRIAKCLFFFVAIVSELFAFVFVCRLGIDKFLINETILHLPPDRMCMSSARTKDTEEYFKHNESSISCSLFRYWAIGWTGPGVHRHYSDVFFNLTQCPASVQGEYVQQQEQEDHSIVHHLYWRFMFIIRARYSLPPSVFYGDQFWKNPSIQLHSILLLSSAVK